MMNLGFRNRVSTTQTLERVQKLTERYRELVNDPAYKRWERLINAIESDS